MSRSAVRRGVLAALCLAIVLGATTSAGASAAAPADAPRRVLIVTLPRVTWADIQREHPRYLTRFFDGAAVASMSTRTVGPKSDPGSSYLTLGAGNRADTLNPLTDGEQANVTESTPDGPANEVYARRVGRRPTGQVVSLTFPEQVARNDALLYGSTPGAFGSALRRAGRTIGVVGNADQADATGRMRQVALAAVDQHGQVPVGNVSDDLLVSDGTAPFGIRLDPTVFTESAKRAWNRADVVVAEMSDLERAEQARAQSLPAQGNAEFSRAMRSSDALFASLLAQMDLKRDLVMVVAPDAPLSREELTVFAMAGKGVARGWATSPTTRRTGFMTLTDVAPTVLERYGIARPDSMNDTPATSSSSSEPLAGRIDSMVRNNERAVFRDQAMGPITVAFIILLALMLIVVAWSVTRRPSWSNWMQILALTVLAVPTVTYLAGLLPYDPFVTVTYGLAILAGGLVLGALARAAGGDDAVIPPLLVSILCLAVLGIDIVTGGWLQINTVFGYSPIVAGRFAGYGNQAFSLLAISALLVATAGWEVDVRRRPDGSRTGRIIAVVALFLVVVVLDGAPPFGADVGGVLASVPAYAVCALLLAGRRIRVRMVALIGLATAAVITLFALIDLARPAESRTHLGRFADKIISGDFTIILQRKLDANLSILTSTVWTLVIPAALIFFAYLTWRPSRILRQINTAYPTFRPFGISALTLGILSWLLNDSGVSMPAIMLTIALPYTALLALGAVHQERPA